MLLKCNECGNENQLGAIFCRECGTKLDVEKMRPKVESKVEKNIAGLVKNIIAIVVLLTLAIVIGLMFFPQSGSSYELTKEEQVKTNAKLQKLIKRLDGDTYSDAKYVFTPDEVTYAFNYKLTGNAKEAETGEDGEETGGYTVDKMTISVDAYDNIVLILETKLFGALPVSFGLNGYLIDDKLDLKVTSAKMGHLSVPGFLHKKIISKFTPVTTEGEIANIISGTSNVKVENGDFYITVKKSAKK